MQTKNLRRWAVAGVLAGLVGVLLPQTLVQAADTPSFPTTSDAAVYLVNGNANTNYAAGAELDWNTPQGAYLSATPLNATPTDYSTVRLPFVAGAEQAITFIAPQGGEKDRTKWKAWSDLVALNGKGVLLPQVTPAYQAYGIGADDGTAATLAPAAIKAAGGTYSLGVAYVKGNGQTVVSAYFTTIGVTAGTGAWKFGTPAGGGSASPTPTPTVSAAATTLALTAGTAKYAGDPVALKATINPAAAAGSVRFYDGANLIGTVNLAGGSETLTTRTLTAGSHAIKAVYAGSTAYAGSTSNTITVKLAKLARFSKVGKVAISGTAKVGKTVKAKVSGKWTPKPKFSYQWLANGKVIKGATKASLKITKVRKGTKLTVKVTASKMGYTSVIKTSKATKKVK
jgi:hypothetical protein